MVSIALAKAEKVAIAPKNCVKRETVKIILVDNGLYGVRDLANVDKRRVGRRNKMSVCAFSSRVGGISGYKEAVQGLEI